MSKMTVIQLLNKIANGEIEDKRTFNIVFKNGLLRSIYYDKDEENCMCCLKNVSDDYSIYDDISFDTEIATIEEEKKIPERLSTWFSVETKQSKELNIEYGNTNFENMYEKINEIIDYLNSKGE